MSARAGSVDAVLALMVLTGALAALGILRSRNAYAALHAANLGGICIPLFLFIAVFIAKAWSEPTLKTFVLALVFWTGGPIVTHAIARACRKRARR